MATTDPLLLLSAAAGFPPVSAGATPGRRTDRTPFFAFDDTTDESLDFMGLVLPEHYGGGGLTVSIHWMAASATSGDVIWDAQIERQNDDGFDLDGDGFAAVQSVTATTANVAGELSYDEIGFTSGSQMDSLVKNESFRLRITRDADNGSDNLSGDAQIVAVYITET